MNDTCISCHAPLKPGAKFCTQCGAPQPVETETTSQCSACHAPLKPGVKFCTQCGAPQAQPTTTASAHPTGTASAPAMTMHKQKIVWNVQPGEIARRINEAELMQYDTALGIIINDGTTAYIKANGKLIAEIHGGAYDFIKPEELESLLNTRIGGLRSGIGNGFRFIANLILGRRVKDQISNQADELRQLQSLDHTIEYLKKGALFSITLKVDKSFQLIFGAVHPVPEEYNDFIPMKVRTRYLDVDMGIRAFFRIEKFDHFADHYLGDNNSVTTRSLAHQITPIVQSVIQECMHDVELNNLQIPSNIVAQVEQKLVQQTTWSLHGIVLEKIVEITASNQDLERLRELSRELYLSDQELDYLHRTNDFKNRLNTEIAQQTLNEAQSDLDLYKRLGEVNKDRLLTEQEFENFYMVLSRERRIQEAQSNLTEIQAQDVINQALADIKRTGLLREEETEILKFQIQERQYHRGYAVKLMQLQNAIEYEKVRTGGEQEVALQAMLHQLEMAEHEDAYKDDRFYKEIEKITARKRAELQLQKEAQQAQNAQVEFAYSLAERGREAQMERLRQMEELDADMEDRASARRMQEQQQLLDDEADRRRIELEGLKTRQGMTAEQIMSEKIADMSEAAQAEFARTFAAGKDVEQERELRKQQEAWIQLQKEERKEENDRLERIMSQMLNTAANISGGVMQNERTMKEEYRQEMHHEQARHDQHQDQALNYTTRYVQPTPSAAPPSAVTNGGSAKSIQKVCPKCQAVCEVNERFCQNCGNEI